MISGKVVPVCTGEINAVDTVKSGNIISEVVVVGIVKNDSGEVVVVCVITGQVIVIVPDLRTIPFVWEVPAAPLAEL